MLPLVLLLVVTLLPALLGSPGHLQFECMPACAAPAWVQLV
jgi:hypothetical protein